MDVKCLFVVAGLLAWAQCSTVPVALEANGYTGVIVAINRNVPEDLTIIRSIEELFKKASPVLYQATRQRAYFKEVIVVIPDTWSTKSHYENVQGDLFSKAHFRIDSPNPEYNNEPYTLQPGGCGEPGQYIHYTPTYLNNPVSDLPFRSDEYPEKRLVQEWSHLRYGVFDEFGYKGNNQFPSFVPDPVHSVIGTTCIKDIPGTSDLGGDCKFSISDGGFIDLDELITCYFVPDTSNDAAASIMFTARLDSVVHFCDDDKDGDRYHNYDAQNRQNKECNHKSTWEVVSSHSDFNQVVPGPDNMITVPKFRYFYSPRISEMRLILVLDISASMKGQPMELLITAASRCIKDHIADGSYLGLVSFSTRSRLISLPTLVSDKSSRERLIRLLPRGDDNGYTAIGRGLTRALEALKANKNKPEGGRILLITDGEENISPYISEILPDLIAARVFVSAIAFGNKASEKLENLTSSTGGKLYLFSDISGSKPPSSLDYAFLQATTVQTDVDFQPVTITHEQIKVQHIMNHRLVYIEDALGRDTVFTLKATDIRQVEMLLEDSSGRKYTSKSHEYNKDEKLQRIKITIPNAKPGMWNVTYIRNLNTDPIVELSVQSTPVDSQTQPVRVRAWTSDAQMTFPATMKIYAEVKKNYVPVIKASVKAIVTRPNAPNAEIRLRDDGAAPDSEKDDGIYTAYFTNFTGSGRYGVLARVVNDGTALLKLPQVKDGKSRVRRNVPTAESDTIEISLEHFERVADGGVFRIDDFSEEFGDLIPPARVTDLVVTGSELINEIYSINIQWTSSGDDMDSGNAASFELRTALEQSELRLAFNTCRTLSDEEWLLAGHLTPNLPGRLQMLTIKLPEDLIPRPKNQQIVTTVYFAVKTMDAANNTAELSNVAWAYIQSPVAKAQDSTYVIYAVVAGSLSLLFLIVLGVVIFLKRKRLREYKSVRRV